MFLTLWAVMLVTTLWVRGRGGRSDVRLGPDLAISCDGVLTDVLRVPWSEVAEVQVLRRVVVWGGPLRDHRLLASQARSPMVAVTFRSAQPLPGRWSNGLDWSVGRGYRWPRAHGELAPGILVAVDDPDRTAAAIRQAVAATASRRE